MLSLFFFIFLYIANIYSKDDFAEKSSIEGVRNDYGNKAVSEL